MITKTHALALRVSDEEKNLVAAAACVAGKSTSCYMRESCINAARRLLARKK